MGSARLFTRVLGPAGAGLCSAQDKMSYYFNHQTPCLSHVLSLIGDIHLCELGTAWSRDSVTPLLSRHARSSLEASMSSSVINVLKKIQAKGMRVGGAVACLLPLKKPPSAPTQIETPD